MPKFVFSFLFLSSMAFAGATGPQGVPPKDKEEVSSENERHNEPEPEQKRRRTWTPRFQIAFELAPDHKELIWAVATGIAEGDVDVVVAILRKLTPAQAAVVLSRHYIYGEGALEAFGTPLHLAAFLGDEDMVRALIRFAFSTPHGMALFALGDAAVIQVAATEGATGVVAALLEAADRNPALAPFILAPNRFGNAFYAAVGKGHLEEIVLFLNFIAPHGVLREDRANLLFAPNLLYLTPLYYAVLTGQPEAARLIVAFAARHPELIPLLLQEGPNGENALETAAFFGETETIAVLLEYANDERMRRFILNRRAFRAAARTYHIEVLRLFVFSPLFRSLLPELPVVIDVDDEAIEGMPEEQMQQIKRLRTMVRNLLLFRFPERAHERELVPGADFTGQLECAVIMLFKYDGTTELLNQLLADGITVNVELLREMLARHIEWTDNGQGLAAKLTRLAGLRLELMRLKANYENNPHMRDNIDGILRVLDEHNLTMFQHTQTPLPTWLGTGIVAALYYRELFGKSPPK